MAKNIPILATFGILLHAAIAQEPAETPPAGVAPFSPQIYPIERYSEIWSKSPFEFEIVVPDVVVEEDNPLDDMFLASYSNRGSYFVAAIYDKTNENEKIRLDSRKGPEENDGYEIVGVLPGPTYKQRQIELKKDGYSKLVGYDSQRFSTPLAAAAGGGNPRVNPAARGGNRNAVARNTARANDPAPQANAPQDASAGNTAAPAAGNTANAAATDRNAVIQRLLDRARQNQGGGNAATPNTPNANGSTDAGDRPRRRRVVLPPSNN